jgi:hypothetical protein
MYQTIPYGVGVTLYQDKKDIWSLLPLWGHIMVIKSIKQAQAKVDTLLSYCFREEIFWRHNPKKIVKDYCSQIKHTWEYTLATW